MGEGAVSGMWAPWRRRRARIEHGRMDSSPQDDRRRAQRGRPCGSRQATEPKHFVGLGIGDGAVEKTRTSTGVTPQRPQRCASTSSATTALAGLLAKAPGVGKARSGLAQELLTRGLRGARKPVWIRCRTPRRRVSSGASASCRSGIPTRSPRWRRASRRCWRGTAGELVWLVEHPPLYTAGTSARGEDLLWPDRFPVYQSRRGGEYTYHGPGQRVAYAMLDLNRRGRDVRVHVWRLEEWVIRTLAEFGVTGERRAGRVGVWVVRPDRPPQADGSPAEDKIAAIGVRIRRWISFHGVAINVEPDLGHFGGIVPCGIRGHGVTSLVDLGLPVSMADVDVALQRSFGAVFG